MSSVKWRPFCLGLNVLKYYNYNLCKKNVPYGTGCVASLQRRCTVDLTHNAYGGKTVVLKIVLMHLRGL